MKIFRRAIIISFIVHIGLLFLFRGGFVDDIRPPELTVVDFKPVQRDTDVQPIEVSTEEVESQEHQSKGDEIIPSNNDVKVDNPEPIAVKPHETVEQILPEEVKPQKEDIVEPVKERPADTADNKPKPAPTPAPKPTPKPSEIKKDDAVAENKPAAKPEPTPAKPADKSAEKLPDIGEVALVDKVTEVDNQSSTTAPKPTLDNDSKPVTPKEEKAEDNKTAAIDNNSKEISETKADNMTADSKKMDNQTAVNSTTDNKTDDNMTAKTDKEIEGEVEKIFKEHFATEGNRISGTIETRGRGRKIYKIPDMDNFSLSNSTIVSLSFKIDKSGKPYDISQSPLPQQVEMAVDNFVRNLRFYPVSYSTPDNASLTIRLKVR